MPASTSPESTETLTATSALSAAASGNVTSSAPGILTQSTPIDPYAASSTSSTPSSDLVSASTPGSASSQTSTLASTITTSTVDASTQSSPSLSFGTTGVSNSSADSTRSNIDSIVTSSLTSAGTVLPASSASATSTTAAITTTPQAESSTRWLTIPTFAGVVAGSFVAGAFIAGLLVFALLKKRSKRSEPERHIDRSTFSSSHDLAYIGEKGSPMMTVTTLVEPNFLPQQAEDAEVKRRILNLTDQIDQHVENFYHNRKVQADGKVEAKVACYETRQMPNSLAACFELATHPSALIKHCLAFHIFSRTIAPGEDTELILPTDIAGMVSAMYNKCLSPNTPSDTIAAFSLWKNLTGYLRAEEGPRTLQTTSSAALNFARQFGAAFSVWSDVQYSEDHRNNHLAALVDDAVDTGIWLFRQPDNYKFSWNMLSYSGRNTAKTFARETVIVPEVFKMSHKGESLSGRGQNIVHAVVKSF